MVQESFLEKILTNNKLKMNQKKNILKKRVSNRRYPLRNCKKPDCQVNYVPTDARQIYCCEQHRVDFNNDKRKEKEAITLLFLNKVKSNEAILKKVKTNDHYTKYRCVKKDLLDYEGYDFNYYHQIMINKKTGCEGHVCFDYILELVDPIELLFIIKKKSENEL